MKVNLKVKEGNKVETIQHEIEEIDLFQFKETLNVFKDILKLAETNEKLQSFINELISTDVDYENDSVEEDILLRKLGSAFEPLLVDVPEKSYQLLSILSDIDYEILMQQKLEDAFEIYDAIIQVNDIDKLVKRAKKSLKITKNHTKIGELIKKKKMEQKQLS